MADDSERYIRRVVYAAAAVVAAFAFVVSYTHIYDLGGKHAQHRPAAQLLPLSVDLLIVAASLVLWLQRRQDARPSGFARWLPRGMLWSGIAATVAANVAYGLPYGWLSALISAWPGAVFAGLVEMVMVTVRPAPAAAPAVPVFAQFTPPVPATAYDAAKAAYAASAAGGNPLREGTLASRFGIPRSQARRILADAVPAPSLNGDGGHE